MPLSLTQCHSYHHHTIVLGTSRSEDSEITFPSLIQISLFCQPKPRVGAFVHGNAGKEKRKHDK